MHTFKPMMIGLLTGVMTFAAGCSTNQATSDIDPQSAPESAVAQEKPYLEFINEREVVAVVSAIDHETREVTLTGETGETAEFIVSDEVRNLDQVSQGDRVYLYLVEDLVIEVFDGEGVSPGEAMVATASRAEQGDMPGMTAGTSESVVYKVEAIDRQAGTYTLSDADGNQETFIAQDPRYLDQAEVGDVVMVSLTRALVVDVEKLSDE
mgnify:CR=1 FL=1